MTNPKGMKPRSGPASLPAVGPSPIETLIASRSMKGKLMVDGVREYVVDIDVPLAEAMLATRHEDQRGLRRTPLARLVDDMKYDRYLWEAIDVMRFSTFGQLIDGQHRLEALRLANLPDKPDATTNGQRGQNGHGAQGPQRLTPGTIVLRNVRVFFLASDGRTAMTVCDGGANRTTPEALKMSGAFKEAIAELIPSQIVRAIVFADSGYDAQVAQRHSRTTTVDLLHNANLQALNRLIEIKRNAKFKLSRGHLAAAYACMAYSKEPDRAYEFFRACFQNEHKINGRDVEQLQQLTSQLILDRDKIQHQGGNRHKAGVSTDAVRAHRCIVFYNAWRKNQIPKVIRFKDRVEAPV